MNDVDPIARDPRVDESILDVVATREKRGVGTERRKIRSKRGWVDERDGSFARGIARKRNRTAERHARRPWRAMTWS